MDLDFIEIGTSDFETLAFESGPESKGISVEPVFEYLERLPSRPGLIKVNAAISDTAGKGTLYRLPPNTIEELGLPRDVRGCNSLWQPHPTILEMLSRRMGRESALKMFVKEEVDMITPLDLLQKFNVNSVELLKIDTEGHDCRILNSYLKDVPAHLLPRRLRFESNCLTSKHEIESTILKLIEHGYVLDNEKTQSSRARPGYEETFMTLN